MSEKMRFQAIKQRNMFKKINHIHIYMQKYAVKN